jgi:dihydrofolate synthase/folylpolyglutamate synthase
LEVLFLNYKQSIEYIKEMEKQGMKLGLDVIRELLSRLGNPQDTLKILHIAGTNGKGSTSCFLTNILKESGYKVGTFNSPSVFGYNERILQDGCPISDEDVAKYISIVRRQADQMQLDGYAAPSAFEIEFAAALVYFKDTKCDFAVLECGLGGRDDATNVIEKKLLAIITSISYDHTALLGGMLSDIAQNKFAIVKDCPLVTYRQCKEVMDVFGAANRLILCDEPISVSHSSSGQVMQYKGEKYLLNQLGKYQLTNCALAIESALYLAQMGYAITPQTIKVGVEKSLWKGRLQKITVGDKTYLLDGAHNPDGARVLAQALQDDFADMKTCFVLGIFKDKDSDGMLKEIGGLAERFFAVTPTSPRGLDSNALVEKCRKYTEYSASCDNIKSAIFQAYASDCDLIVVCGSLSILADALDSINQIRERI